jgi:hypothetical protein
MNKTPRNSRDNRENGDGKSEKHEAEALKTLLLSEMAAVEAYETAMSRLRDHHVLAGLEKIRDEHGRAVTALRSHGTGPDARPRESAGPWSTVAVAVNGTAGIISTTTALWALCQGEERAINEYENALAHDGLSAESKQLIRIELLPRARRHLDELNRLMGGMK